MSTGYTDKVATGEISTLKEYAIECSNAFLNIRPLPRKIEPLKYHYERLEELKEETLEVMNMSQEKWEIEASKEYAINMEYRRNDYESRSNIRNNYKDMIAIVTMWQIPEELEKLKEFMLDQLVESKRVDCYEPELTLTPITRLSGKDWHLKKVQNLCTDMIYHIEKWFDELKRVEDTNNWLEILWETIENA